MSQLLAAAGPYTLTKTWYVDGTALDVGAVTIGITDANGDTVVASSTATTNNADGTYTYSLADQSEVNQLTATWTRSDTGADLVDSIETVGAWLFTEAALRAFDDAAISDTTAYTDSAIADMHTRVVDYIEEQTSRAVIPRYNRIVAAGTGTRYLDVNDGISRQSTGTRLHRPGSSTDINSIISANDGASVTTSNIVILDSGLLQRTDASWTASSSSSPLNVTVEYEYGARIPGAERIGMLLARHWLVASRIPSNAAAFTDALGTYQFDETRLPYEAYKWLKDQKTGGYFA